MGRGRSNTDRWERKRLRLADGRTVGWTVDPDPYPHIVAFFRLPADVGRRLLQEAGHPDAELPYGLRPEDQGSGFN
jgi:hypothetical protein